jgi:hypothetical protein
MSAITGAVFICFTSSLPSEHPAASALDLAHRLLSAALEFPSMPSASAWNLKISLDAASGKQFNRGVVLLTPRGSQEMISKYLGEVIEFVCAGLTIVEISSPARPRKLIPEPPGPPSLLELLSFKEWRKPYLD